MFLFSCPLALSFVKEGRKGQSQVGSRIFMEVSHSSVKSRKNNQMVAKAGSGWSEKN